MCPQLLDGAYNSAIRLISRVHQYTHLPCYISPFSLLSVVCAEYSTSADKGLMSLIAYIEAYGLPFTSTDICDTTLHAAASRFITFSVAPRGGMQQGITVVLWVIFTASKPRTLNGCCMCRSPSAPIQFCPLLVRRDCCWTACRSALQWTPSLAIFSEPEMYVPLHPSCLLAPSGIATGPLFPLVMRFPLSQSHPCNPQSYFCVAVLGNHQCLSTKMSSHSLSCLAFAPL